MDPTTYLLLILTIGIILGILLGMSGLVMPLLILAGIIVAGKILLPLVFPRE